MHTETFTADVSRLVYLISERLDDEPLAFVRELISNAVDATVGMPRGQVRVELDPGRSLKISDNGRGISPEEIREALGTIARSYKATDRSRHTMGEFGLGILSTRAVARDVTIRSTKDGVGVQWHWDGSSVYRWSVVRSGSPGTEVAVRFRDDTPAIHLGHDELMAFIRTTMPFVSVPIVYGSFDTPLNDPRPPWLYSRDVAQWAREHGATGSQLGATGRFPGGLGGVAIALPDASTQWYEEARIHRYGVVVTGSSGLVGAEFSWLKVWIDLPEASLTLDRRRLVVESASNVQSVVTERLDASFLHQLLPFVLNNMPSAWWDRHRENLLRLLAAVIERGHIDSRSRDRLRDRLRFLCDLGMLTIVELEARPSAEGIDVSFDSAYERRIFEFLVRGSKLDTGAAGASSRVGTADHGEMSRIVRRLDGALAGLGVAVRLGAGFGADWEMAKWERRPEWIRAPGSRAASSSLGALRERTRSPHGATLLLNPRCGSLRLLGEQLDDEQLRTAGLLLSEWAHARSTQQLVHMTRLRSALFQIIGESVALPREGQRPRCFVAYDWTSARREFDAVCRALRQAPFEMNVLDASDESRGRFFLTNVTRIMESCQVLISVITMKPDSDGAMHLNPNVLIEIGMAEALRSRPHIICKPRSVTLPTDYDGVIAVLYDDPRELEHELRRYAKRRGLDRAFGRH